IIHQEGNGRSALTSVLPDLTSLLQADGKRIHRAGSSALQGRSSSASHQSEHDSQSLYMKVSQESCRRPWMANCLQWYPDHISGSDKTQILFVQNIYLFA
ncbi:AAEL000606-PA, partial [Aedes aegypti]